MVFNKEIGKLLNRKKSTNPPPRKVDGESRVGENTLSSNLEGQNIELGISSAGLQAPVDSFSVLESYPLNAPFAFAKVTRDLSRGSITYAVEEPVLSENDLSNLQRLKAILNEVLQLKPTELHSKKAAGDYLVKKINEIFDNYNFKPKPETRSKLLYYVIRDNLGFGKIDPLMHDPLIEDISCDGVNVPLYIWHRKFESIPTNIRFKTAEELDTYALR